MPLQTSRKPADRWTEAIIQEGWTPIPLSFLRLYSGLKPPISSQEAMLLIHIVSFKWDEKMPFPGVATLSRRMGLRESTVRAHLRTLQGKSYLERIHRPGRTNLYSLRPLFDAIEQALAAEVESRRQSTLSKIGKGLETSEPSPEGEAAPPRALPIRHRAGVWEVGTDPRHWQAVESESDAHAIASAPILEYEALEKVRRGPEFARQLQAVARVLEKYQMGFGARFFSRRAQALLETDEA